MTFIAPLASALGSIGASAVAPSPTAPALSGAEALYADRTYINIAPVGVNIGEILKALDSGPLETGGSGFMLSSFFGGQPTVGTQSQGMSLTTMALLLGGGLLVLFLVKSQV